MGKEMLKNNVKVYRARLNLTQEELAIKAGVTRKTINTVENGVFIPSALLAIKIAKIFNDTVENVFYIDYE